MKHLIIFAKIGCKKSHRLNLTHKDLLYLTATNHRRRGLLFPEHKKKPSPKVFTLLNQTSY
jgi:hypothetical protein